MNTQLQLLDNATINVNANKAAKTEASRKYSKRKLGTHKVESSEERPWKLSEKDRNQGLAGIAMIKQILASVPNTISDNGENQYAQAS